MINYNNRLKPRKIVIFVLVIMLISAGELFGYLKWRKYSLFYNVPKQAADESLPLYSILDPLLGYTFTSEAVKGHELYNPNINSLDKSLNGYVIFKHEGKDERPIKVLTLGNCSTDSNLFGGNWPYQLHLLLKENNRSHIIYNGGVSGYSSSQEFLKLWRDVSVLDRLDVIISYTGAADAEISGDTVLNHPHSHPYEYKTYRNMLRMWPEDKMPAVLPNMFYAIKKIFDLLFQKDLRISLGVRAQTNLDRHLMNLKYSHKVAESNGVKYVAFVQDSFPPSKEQPQGLSPVTYSHEESEGISRYLTSLEMATSAFPFIYTMRGKIPLALFIDNNHLSPSGSRHLALEIYNKVLLDLL